MKHKIILAICGLLTASCATPPARIQPAQVDAGKFAHLSCNELLSTLYVTNDAVAPLAAKQQKTSSNDELGMFLIGVPTGSMGDKQVKQRESDIARLKGEMEAINKTRVAKKCP